MGIPAAAGVAASGLPPAGDQASAVLSGVFTAVGPSQPFAFRGPMNLVLYASIVTTLNVTAGSLAATVASATGLAAGASINSTLVPPGTTAGALSGTDVTLSIPPITLPGQVGVSAPRIFGLPSTAGLVGATVAGPGIPSGTTVLSVEVAAVAATNDSPGSPGTVRISANPTSAPADTGGQPSLFTFRRTGNAVPASGADAAALFTGAGVSFTGSVQIERSFDGGLTFVPCNIGGGGQLAVYTAGTPISLTFGEPERQVLYRLNCTALSAGNINYRISQTGGANESLAIGPLSGG